MNVDDSTVFFDEKLCSFLCLSGEIFHDRLRNRVGLFPGPSVFSEFEKSKPDVIRLLFFYDVPSSTKRCQMAVNRALRKAKVVRQF